MANLNQIQEQCTKIGVRTDELLHGMDTCDLCKDTLRGYTMEGRGRVTCDEELIKVISPELCVTSCRILPLLRH